MTRYTELIEAMDSNNELWRQYENDCRQFIGTLRKHLVDFLECDDDGVIVPKYPEMNESEVEAMFGHKLILAPAYRNILLFDDAFWRFAFHIKTSRSGWLIVLLQVKRVDTTYIVKFGDDQYTINQSSDPELDTLVKSIYEDLIDYLGNEFQGFLEGKPQPPQLGFKVGGEQ